MVYRTFGDLRQQVEAELDTQDEEFVSLSEIQRYFNSGVTLIEASIIKLGLREKYLQTEAFIDTVAGQTDYPLPTDCTITKIRKVVYRNGTLVYTVRPLRGEDGFQLEDIMGLYPPNEYYHYSLYKNAVNSGYSLRLTPKAFLDVSQALRVIYFKTLNRYTADADLCDLPDICYEFLMTYVRYRTYLKETHVNTPEEKGNMVVAMNLMQETLQNQVADPEMDEMDKDMSHYEEMI